MHIQLVQPPRNEGYVSNSRTACYPPLGLLSLATHCQNVFPDASVTVMDGEWLSVSEIERRITPGAIVGVETKMLNYESALRIARAAKKRNCTVVFGGVHASAVPKAILRNRGIIVDFVVEGYGEHPFVDIVRAAAGLGERPARHCIDRRPPFNRLLNVERDWLIELKDYSDAFRRQHERWAQYTATNIFTVQGCEYKCLFCDRQTPGGAGRVWHRQPQRIWGEVLELFQNHGVNYVVSFDDQIAQNVEWLNQLVETRPRMLDGKVAWHVFSTASNITPESVRLLKRLGVVHVFVGIETGDPKLARSVGKGPEFSPERCRRAVQLLAGEGIVITPSFVVGLPGESEQTLEVTLRFAKELKRIVEFEEIFAACLMPFAGSRAFAMLARSDPTLSAQDLFEAEQLTERWFGEHCRIRYERGRQQVAALLELAPYRITLDKGGHPMS